MHSPDRLWSAATNPTSLVKNQPPLCRRSIIWLTWGEIGTPLNELVMARKQKKGIYCIEGFWEQGDVINKASVLPLLELLHQREQVPFTHHRCGTKEEILFMLSRWKGAVQKKYPILYFATHGNEGELDFGKEAKIRFEDLELHLSPNPKPS